LDFRNFTCGTSPLARTWRCLASRSPSSTSRSTSSCSRTPAPRNTSMMTRSRPANAPERPRSHLADGHCWMPGQKHPGEAFQVPQVCADCVRRATIGCEPPAEGFHRLLERLRPGQESKWAGCRVRHSSRLSLRFKPCNSLQSIQIHASPESEIKVFLVISSFPLLFSRQSDILLLLVNK